MRISDWSSDVCSSDLLVLRGTEVLWEARVGPAPHQAGLRSLYSRGWRRLRSRPHPTCARDRSYLGRRPSRITVVQVRDPCQQSRCVPHADASRSEEHTSELQSLMRISYAVFRLKKKI